MENLIRIIFLISILQSCSSDINKEKLIGNWSAISGPSEFEFYKDSLIVNEMGISYINDWHFDQYKLYLKPIKGLDSFGIKNTTFDYRISKNQDTLFIKRQTDSVFGEPILRIKNGYDYFFKQLQLSIDLPIKNELISCKQNGIGLDVYVGFRNSKLIAKTDNDIVEDLGKIKEEALAFFAYQKNMLDSTNFQFNLLMDKNINHKKIDSIKDILKSTGHERMFIVYNNNKIDYKKTGWKEELHWFGCYE